MASSDTKRRGRKSVFHAKVRKPVSLTLTPAHHAKVNKNMARLGLTRADFIGLLIERHADTVSSAGAYDRLKQAVQALGGTLAYSANNGPIGGRWILSLGGKVLPIPTRHPALLDACFQLQDSVAASRAREGELGVVDPAGLAKLFTELASQPDGDPE